MSRKKRVLRLALIVLGVLFVAGFGAFSTFFFNPFEGGLGVDVAGLVNRDVDLFVARADLAEVFDGFPQLRVQEQLEKHPAFKVWSASPEHAELLAELGIDQALSQLAEVQQQMPLGLEPLSLAGGRDLAVAADFERGGKGGAQWAVYGTLSWMGKLALSAVRHPSWIGLSSQGIVADVGDDWVELSGGQLQRKLYVARLKDVGIVATSPKYVQDALERVQLQYQDSMLLRAEYGDHIQAHHTREGDEVEVWVNLRALFESLDVSGAWPDASSQDFLPAFLARYFQANLLNYVAGTIGVRNGLTADLRGQLSSELMTPQQARSYRRQSADLGELRREVAALAPADTSFMLYFREDIGDMLQTALESMLPETRQLLEDAFQQTGRFQNLQQLIEFFDDCLRGRALLIVRQNDYPEDPDGPPHDDQAVPAIALVLWIRDEAKAKELEGFRDLIGGHPRLFGLRGRNDAEAGYYKNIEAGYDTREFWNPLIPGTGVVATSNALDNLCIVTNSHPMLAHILRTTTQGAPEYPRLSDRGDFEALLGTSLPAANLLAWLDPQHLAPILRRQARRTAEDAVVIDWAAERSAAERAVVAESFPEHQAAWERRQLPAEVQEQLDQLVDPLLQRRREEIMAERVPALLGELERRIVYLEAVRAALLMIQLDSRFLELSLRVVAPLER